MLKPLLAVLAVVELLAPERVIESGERLALENPGEASLQSWATPVARLEGLIVLAALLKPDRFSGPVRSVLGWYGLLAVLSPRGFIDYWTEIVYEDATKLVWKPWIVPATRSIGALYVLLALFGWSSDETEND